MQNRWQATTEQCQDGQRWGRTRTTARTRPSAANEQNRENITATVAVAHTQDLPGQRLVLWAIIQQLEVTQIPWVSETVGFHLTILDSSFCGRVVLQRHAFIALTNCGLMHVHRELCFREEGFDAQCQHDTCNLFPAPGWVALNDVDASAKCGCDDVVSGKDPFDILSILCR